MKSLFFILILLACLEKDAAGQAKPLTPPAPPPGKVAEKKDSASQVININDNHATININPPSQNQNSAAQKQTPTPATGGLQVIEFRNDHGQGYLNATSLPFEQPFLLSGNTKYGTIPYDSIVVTIKSDPICHFPWVCGKITDVPVTHPWVRSGKDDSTFLIYVERGLDEVDAPYTVSVGYYKPSETKKLSPDQTKKIVSDLSPKLADPKFEESKFIADIKTNVATALSTANNSVDPDSVKFDFVGNVSDSVKKIDQDTYILKAKKDTLNAIQDTLSKAISFLRTLKPDTNIHFFSVPLNNVNASFQKRLENENTTLMGEINSLPTEQKATLQHIISSARVFKDTSARASTSVTDDQLKAYQLNLVFGIGVGCASSATSFPFFSIGAQIYVLGVRNWAFQQDIGWNQLSVFVGTAIDSKPMSSNVQLQPPFGPFIPMFGVNIAFNARISLGLSWLIFQLPTTNPFLQNGNLDLVFPTTLSLMFDFDIFKDILSLAK